MPLLLGSANLVAEVDRPLLLTRGVEPQCGVTPWLRKMVLEVDGRLSAQAMDKLQGLSRLGSANLVRPRRCLNGPSNSASRHRQGDRRDKPLHPSQIAGGGPFTFLKEEKQQAWKDHL